MLVGSKSCRSQVQIQFEKLILTFEIGILHALLKAFNPHTKTEVVLFTSQDLVVRESTFYIYGTTSRAANM